MHPLTGYAEDLYRTVIAEAVASAGQDGDKGDLMVCLEHAARMRGFDREEFDQVVELATQVAMEGAG